MTKTTASSDVKTRRAILERLKLGGPQTASQLAKTIGVSAMAIRQHLYALAEQKLVAATEEARGRGRPSKYWHLTEAAYTQFPDRHGDLAYDLIGDMKAALGESAMEALLEVRTKRQIADYSARMADTRYLEDRVNALAEIRSAEGYMAEAHADEAGSFLLIENHCPVCQAAKACSGICASELELFRAVLGPDVTVERTDHIIAGARRCAYRISG